jgi:very-short-patch-repair endonuclease
MWICKHCCNGFNNLSPSEKANHSRWCKMNPKNKIYLDKLLEIRNNISKESREKQGKSLEKAHSEGKYDNVDFKGFKGKNHSEKTKINMSISKKKWMKEKPQNHIWNFSKNKSIPCEFLKNKLNEFHIKFEEEYKPLYPNRFFAIDIAFPDKKIGIEINGNQHYNKDKTLKSYYQERHDLIEKDGWKIYEFHYLLAYDDKILDQIKKLIAL